jgi:cation:H+ antiporter
VISAVYLVLAIGAAIHNRDQVLRTLTSPFRRTEKPAERVDELLNV